jgi:hypothetical protein
LSIKEANITAVMNTGKYKNKPAKDKPRQRTKKELTPEQTTKKTYTKEPLCLPKRTNKLFFPVALSAS